MRTSAHLLYRRARRSVGKVVLKVAPGALRYVRPSRADTAGYSALELDRLASGETRRGGMGLPGTEQATKAVLAGRVTKARFVHHIAWEPPPAGVVFAAVCNDRYAPGLEALVLSMLDVYPQLSNRFVVYHDDSLSPFARARLASLYPEFDFIAGNPDDYAVAMGDSYNHKRVGRLGYLTLAAIGIEDADHVVILDSDLLVLGDISPLWHGDSAKAVPDIGQRPYAVVTEATGRCVLNSGVLSLPRSERGPEALERAAAVLARIDDEKDPDLASFADQKFWNLLLADRDVELLPQNFNMVKTLLETAFPEEIGTVQILHVTGPKPWFPFVSRDLVTPEDRARYEAARQQFPRGYALWTERYLHGLAKARLGRFQREEGPALDSLADASDGRPTLLIGNGPSLSRTDMSMFDGYTKVAFNWFVNHDDFDAIAPDHLVLASHMFFGGWHTPRPEVPQAFLDALAARAHKPTLWAPSYFKEHLQTVPELKGYQIRYFFYEKPFKREISHSGVVSLDLRQPLVDSHTGVLTIGVPLARLLGSTDAVLVGCDSNYGSAQGSYFYSASQHGSATTDEASLLRTWSAGGAAFYAYKVVAAEAARQGLRLRDATVDGHLDMLERLTLDEARELAAPAR